MTCSEELASKLDSEPHHTRLPHFRRIEEDPSWALVLGIGYTDAQRRSMIYRHLQKLQSQLHEITGGDVMKSKQLSELMYVRFHAKEARQTAEHKRDVAEGIVLSIRSFVESPGHSWSRSPNRPCIRPIVPRNVQSFGEPSAESSLHSSNRW